jgi:dihydropteroate synthase
VLPVIEALADRGAVSVDTTKEEVARGAVAAGATVINDVSADLAPVAADLGVAWVAMHRQGSPATMQEDPRYVDVVREVCDHLVGRAEAAVGLGVPGVWIDPGIGFGKTLEHNLQLLAHLDRFVATGFPVLVGTSRKALRLEGSLASATWAMLQGVAMIRAHDVLPTVQAARVVAA